jgi:DNA mismatch repair ATPase MutS
VKNKLLKFVEFDSFYSNYKPLTPYGINAKNSCRFFKDEILLKSHHDTIDAAVNFIKNKPQNVDKIEYHLKRIPELPLLENPDLDSTGLFLVKKFLMNFKSVFDLLGETEKEVFQCSFESDSLLKEFLKGGVEESFHISDKYCDNLKKIRRDIEKISAELKSAKEKRTFEIKEKFGYDFTMHDFLVVEDSNVSPNKDYFYIEPFDSRHIVIKPVMADGYYALFNEREQMMKVEKELEYGVIKELSQKVIKEKESFERYIAAVEKIDTYIANGKTVLKFNMTRPVIGEHKGISIINGRNIIEQERCGELGTEYQPLTARFDGWVSVIHGSNMGGKTVLLRTVGLFQTLVQAGFYVPAGKFSAQLFDNIFYIGDHEDKSIKGLSSFAMEIVNFLEAKKGDDGTALYLMDEFAKTTDSDEATALITAVIKDFSDNEKTTAFISTHFKGLPKIENVSFYRMKGLDIDEYEKCYKKEYSYTLIERIRLINSFMKYEVIPDTPDHITSDALKIAEMLGLDSSTVKNAAEYLKGKG